jgi:hypothetical protein
MFLGPSRQKLRQYLKLGHDQFLSSFIIQDIAIEYDDFQIAVLMNWVECKKQTITEYQQ